MGFRTKVGLMFCIGHEGPTPQRHSPSTLDACRCMVGISSSLVWPIWRLQGRPPAGALLNPSCRPCFPMFFPPCEIPGPVESGNDGTHLGFRALESRRVGHLRWTPRLHRASEAHQFEALAPGDPMKRHVMTCLLRLLDPSITVNVCLQGSGF